MLRRCYRHVRAAVPGLDSSSPPVGFRPQRLRRSQSSQTTKPACPASIVGELILHRLGFHLNANRYFAANSERPFCPYGRDCFYRHLKADGTEHVFNQGVDVLMEQFKRQRQRQGMLRPRQPFNPPATLTGVAAAFANEANHRPAGEREVNFTAEGFLVSLRTIAAALVPTAGTAGGEDAGYRIGDGVVRMRGEQVRVLESLFASVGVRETSAE